MRLSLWFFPFIFRPEVERSRGGGGCGENVGVGIGIAIEEYSGAVVRNTLGYFGIGVLIALLCGVQSGAFSTVSEALQYSLFTGIVFGGVLFCGAIGFVTLYVLGLYVMEMIKRR